MEADGYELEILDVAQCLALAHTVSIGRIALSVHAMPIILPMSFTMLNGEPVFPIGSGSIARAAQRNEVVCFETDWVDPTSSAAWSIAIVGKVSLVSDPVDLDTISARDFGSWAGPPQRFARVHPVQVTGRRRTVTPAVRAT